MNNFLDQLNLTPQERRIVVAIGLVVIVVLNLLFVSSSHSFCLEILVT